MMRGTVSCILVNSSALADQLQVGTDLYNGRVIQADSNEIIFDPDCSGEPIVVQVSEDVEINVNGTCDPVDPPAVGGGIDFCMWILTEHSDSFGVPQRGMVPKYIASIIRFDHSGAEYRWEGPSFSYKEGILSLGVFSGPWDGGQMNVVFSDGGELFDFCASIDDDFYWNSFSGCAPEEPCIHPITGVDGKYWLEE